VFLLSQPGPHTPTLKTGFHYVAHASHKLCSPNLQFSCLGFPSVSIIGLYHMCSTLVFLLSTFGMQFHRVLESIFQVENSVIDLMILDLTEF
jgi:hypothetical protein